MIKNMSKFIVLIAIFSSCSNKESFDINTIKENIQSKIKIQQDLTNNKVAEILDNSSLIFKDTIYFMILLLLFHFGRMDTPLNLLLKLF